MMDPMMCGAMMWGMGLIGLLVIVVLILAAARAVRSNGRPCGEAYPGRRGLGALRYFPANWRGPTDGRGNPKSVRSSALGPGLGY